MILICNPSLAALLDHLELARRYAALEAAERQQARRLDRHREVRS